MFRPGNLGHIGRLGLGASKSVSPERVANGTFDSGINEWTSRRAGALSNPSNRLRVTNSSGLASGGADTTISCIIGRQYCISMRIAATSAGRYAFLRVGDKNMDSATVSDFRLSVGGLGAGSYTATFTATQSQHFVFAQIDGGTNGEWVEFDDFSVR